MEPDGIDMATQIAARVRQAILAADTTYHAVAAAIEVSKSAFSLRMNARRNFTAPQILGIALFLEVPVESLYPEQAAA
jgi:transcriptional regulator with XRE-family HTH domain